MHTIIYDRHGNPIGLFPAQYIRSFPQPSSSFRSSRSSTYPSQVSAASGVGAGAPYYPSQASQYQHTGPFQNSGLSHASGSSYGGFSAFHTVPVQRGTYMSPPSSHVPSSHGSHRSSSHVPSRHSSHHSSGCSGSHHSNAIISRERHRNKYRYTSENRIGTAMRDTYNVVKEGEVSLHKDLFDMYIEAFESKCIYSLEYLRVVITINGKDESFRLSDNSFSKSSNEILLNRHDFKYWFERSSQKDNVNWKIVSVYRY